MLGGSAPQRIPAQKAKGTAPRPQPSVVSPAPVAVHAGSAVTLEALLRGTPNPTWDITRMSGPISCAAQNLRVQVDGLRCQPAASFSTHLSLARTVLKMLLIRTSPAAALGPSAVNEDTCISLLVALEGLLPSVDHPFRVREGNLVRGAYRHPCKARLTAVLVMVLIRLENWKLRQLYRNRGRPDEGNLWFYLPWSETLREDVQLASVAARLVLNKEYPGGWIPENVAARLEAQVWQGYAIKHFHGRLLSGCCHLGCTNLEGVCEAALPTLLCRGCRRVRYCSRACQRKAWVEGMHGMVCGRGEWSI
ncbi:MAG: hypothetical protein WDW38_003586 [Sanguina aurantia]